MFVESSTNPKFRLNEWSDECFGGMAKGLVDVCDVEVHEATIARNYNGMSFSKRKFGVAQSAGNANYSSSIQKGIETAKRAANWHRFPLT